MPSLESNIRRVLDILLPKIQSRRQTTPQPAILGITGLQGSGKSTWAGHMVELLTREHHVRAVTISLDDLYKTHGELVAQRDKDPENKLYRTRGQPGTHDERLAAHFFGRLREYAGEGELSIPSFDKSLFNGEGDRAPESAWPRMRKKPDVVVFEGWCVGFRPIGESAVGEIQALAEAGTLPVNTPATHSLSHLVEVDKNLRRYCDAFMGPQHFDFMLHIDTDDLRNVYTWRLEQEHKLIEQKGSGMSDEGVRAFVDGYMPAYELYLPALRKGFFEEMGEDGHGRQVRVVLTKDRNVERIEEM